MTLQDLETRVRSSLARPLPGAEAHLLLAPRPRPGWQAGHLPDHARPAAGLLLFYAKGEDARLILTVRSDRLASHRGQVSLPGGAVEPGETIVQAALREAAEEIGVDSAEVRVLGTLTALHIPVSDFTLHPVVGVDASGPVFRAADDEVERILEVPVRHLLDPTRLRTFQRVRNGVEISVPYFDLEGERVWGATAMVLSEFLWLMGRKAEPQE
jgi:8-oxo-dGTP pyrophosphatase MutT (NUDIX family)